MAFKWASIPLFILLWSTSASCATSDFENTAIVRSAELGGSVVHVTTTYSVRALVDNSKTYTVVLGAYERSKTSWIEAKIKGQDKALPTTERAESDYTLIDVSLPTALSTNKTLNLVLETVQTHATVPWPATAAQTEEQKLKYGTDLFVLSPYKTLIQRTKLRSIAPRIVAHTEPQGVDKFAGDALVTKSGSTIVYGPYSNIPPSANQNFVEEYQQRVEIQYYLEQPVLEVTEYKRAVEVSHWGANVNTQDEITLHNAGPKLKGHFSRLEHQVQSYTRKLAPHLLPALQLNLPAGIRNAYYYDQIGNVSTSKLRVAPLGPKGFPRSQQSVLELKPRYPLLGGWNYTFTLGWDAPLEGSVSYNKKTGAYTLAVPILTPVPGSVVNNEELTIILPEGATDVDFATPFAPVSATLGTHVTYLDTVGRPSITLRYENLTLKHAQEVYVTYKVPFTAHLRKAVSVAFAFFSLFAVAIIARRIDLSIGPKQKVQ
ncbi:oligosaccharyltransferase alpha subunit [Coprinopsis marcescibilis]|uniref:Dolichyl-diphosphooligosaccharide--protein glycosyltransferase subunit 1 n=1 Tax=Coprinopsis marcescibilis TaxID=230819 RepID=A0A5C3L7M4_COPMA|nr:oligosaccharyltransferase alpha subunit [Coprinopsis marcescibilis]